MNHVEPKSLQVTSSAAYEHVIYRADDGRVFVTVAHDSGFATYSETIVLTEAQQQTLGENRDRLIRDLRDSFGGPNNEFRLAKSQKVENFDNWHAATLAIQKWRQQEQEHI